MTLGFTKVKFEKANWIIVLEKVNELLYLT